MRRHERTRALLKCRRHAVLSLLLREPRMFRRTCLMAGLFVLGLGNSAAFASKLPMPIAQNLPIEIVLDQPQLAVDLSPVAADVAQQFGVIGGLVGVAIQKGQDRKADAAVAPLREMLAGYPFQEHLENALHEKLASEGISPNPGFTLLRKPWDEVDAQTAPHVPLHALVLYPRYSIDAGFTRLSVRLFANVVDREIDDEGVVDDTVGFARVYEFQFPLVKE
ncbi:MAG TPA: hypothetical protein VK753_11245, partial [Xanthomonadaceae bacterium]|nr:hypothetical protein [Xanthomonadaceae bacterium]